MDREAWRAAIHGVTKSRTRLSNWWKQRLYSWRAQIKSCMHQDPEERSSDLTEEPDLPASVGGSPVEAWVSSGSPLGWGAPAAAPGRCPLV